MIQHIKYSDIDTRVDQFGFVDLISAMTNGVVPQTASTDSLSFDGEDVDVNSVGRLVKNSFDAIDNLQSIRPSE